MRQQVDAGRSGGQASGKAKRRSMKGVKPGRGSAGRANANGQKHEAKRRPKDWAAGPFHDIDVAFREWCMRKGIVHRGMADVIAQSCSKHRPR